MKREYVRPMAYAESFAANRAVATACKSSTVTPECLTGTQKDSRTLISDAAYSDAKGNALFDNSSCKIKAHYASGITTAIKYSRNGGGSAGTEYDYTDGGVRYNAKSGAIGLLYFCVSTNGGDPSFDQWTVTSNELEHASGHQNYHCEVIGVFQNAGLS